MRLLFVFFLLSFHTSVIAKQKLTFFTDQWCPYVCTDNKMPGYHIEIVKEIFGDKYEIDVKFVPWERATKSAINGKADLTSAAPGDTDKLIFPKEKLTHSQSCFVGRKSDPWKYKGISSLNSKLLIVFDEWLYGKAIDDYVKKEKNNPNRLRVLNGNQVTTDRALKILTTKSKVKRGDLYVDDGNVLKYNLKSNGLDQLELKGCGPADPEIANYTVAISPKHPKSKELEREFSMKLKKMKDSGEFKKRLEKYGLALWSSQDERQFMNFLNTKQKTPAVSH